MFILVLALLVFGPKKLPELGRTVAKALGEFRRASNELKSTFEREMKDIERETESVKEVTQSYHNEIQNYSYGYDDSSNSYYDSASYNPESYDESTASNPSAVGASATEGADTVSDPDVPAEVALGEQGGQVASTGYDIGEPPESTGEDPNKQPVPSASAEPSEIRS
jgi:sec-independent protein translocase protein TatA